MAGIYTYTVQHILDNPELFVNYRVVLDESLVREHTEEVPVSLLRRLFGSARTLHKTITEPSTSVYLVGDALHIHPSFVHDVRHRLDLARRLK